MEHRNAARPILERMENRILFSQINAADFGAVPDDGRSDTAAVQRAINASKPGDTIQLGTGVYEMHEVLVRSDRSYRGEGAVLRGRDEFTFKIQGDGRDITISGLRFARAGISLGAGSYYRNITITGNTFTDIAAPAIKMTVSSDRVSIEQNTFQNVTGYGTLLAHNVNRLSYSDNRMIDVKHGGHILGPLDDCKFNNNRMTGVSIMGLEIQRNSGGDSVSRNLEVIGNMIYDWKQPVSGAFGLSVIAEGGLNTQIRNNYLRNNVAAGSDWGKLNWMGKVFGPAIEAGFETGAVEGNVSGGPNQWATHVGAAGIDMPVRQNSFYGSTVYGPYIAGWPSIYGEGTFIDDGNSRDKADEMPPPPSDTTPPARSGATAPAQPKREVAPVNVGPAPRDEPAPPAAPVAPVAPVASTPRRDFDWLSNLPWARSSSGWGEVERDQSNGERRSGDGSQLQINGRKYEKGLGVAMNSEIIYDLKGKYQTFFAHIGLDDSPGERGSMTFQVWADGSKIYDSGVVTGAMAGKALQLNIKGTQVLRLVTTDAGDGTAGDFGNWAGAKLVRAAT